MTKARLIWFIVLMCVWIGGEVVGETNDPSQLRRSYKFGCWYGFKEIRGTGLPELLLIANACQSSEAAVARLSVVDVISCDCLRSKYYLVVVDEDETGSTRRIYRWIAYDPTAEKSYEFDNSLDLEDYVKDDYTEVANGDSATALNCVEAVITILSPNLPVFFLEECGDLTKLTSAINGHRLWEKVAVDDPLHLIVGSAKCSGASMRRLMEFADSTDSLTAWQRECDSLACSPIPDNRECAGQCFTRVTWSPSEGMLIRWRVSVDANGLRIDACDFLTDFAGTGFALP